MPGDGFTLDQRTFKKLSRLYILALSAIAFSVIVSQILIHKYLDDQESDSTVVNIAGRQRMLSQKLTKETLKLLIVENRDEKLNIKDSIEAALNIWKFSHTALRQGNDSLGLPGNNSAEITAMFQEVDPFFQNITNSSEAIIEQLEENPQISAEGMRAEIATVARNEAGFLHGMDQIVNRFEEEAGEKVRRLENLEWLLMAITLIILLSELLFIFLPAAKGVRGTIQKLLQAEKDAKKMAKDADELSNAKEKSVKELRVLNQAMNQTLLFARLDVDGNILELGEKFSRLFKLRKYGDYNKFSDLLSAKEEERKHIEHLLEDNFRKEWQGEVKATTEDGRTIWLEMALIPFSTTADNWEILVIASDITTRKEAQIEIEDLRQKRFQEKIDQQKLVSSKIIENQENEQNRIAKDIHDGIGQMLTGLNFNLESIDVKQTEKAAKKIENLKQLTGEIIKGVRTATFNLMPPELSDYGIVPALTKLTQELSRLTGKNIILYDKTGYNQRLDSLAEINIYRITQEAINNAIKYADSTHIIVSVSHSNTILSVTIDDNGKGFKTTKNKTNRPDSGGMGMTFMRERIKYIQGRLFVTSEVGKGTKITLNIPLTK
ncbi:type IV pili methyl-accepting chemotaxis transducer N-terminal domain-containing protein [Salegentibacter sp. F188]|uniref:Oxygen sensor histidine kinase NreB n=1 Tax=Autumnicola patrickiae TaxID=3075591 RepID=A0ABU3E3R4_9FLAO|nr:ATP-binding protein [Salegentibacter sp. F188]MDT0689892.1 type IV pili methyl-accepting chemotaxis transducer N-terminal domain-containing protein [Salegentibacter sp. F188]